MSMRVVSTQVMRWAVSLTTSPFRAEVKNEWSYTSAFITCLRALHRSNSAFLLVPSVGGMTCVFRMFNEVLFSGLCHLPVPCPRHSVLYREPTLRLDPPVPVPQSSVRKQRLTSRYRARILSGKYCLSLSVSLLP